MRTGRRPGNGEDKMEEEKGLRHRVLEVIEGGLRGNRGARIFSWTAFILILLSNSFFLLTKIEEPGEKLRTVFEIVEIATIALFTAEVILGLWTADLRFPEEKHPHLTFLKQPMTIVAILAILPFYLGLVLKDPKFESVTETMEFLTLLHLVKAAEIMKSSRGSD